MRIRSLEDLSVPRWTSRLVYSTQQQETYQLTGVVSAGCLADSSLLVANRTEVLVLGPQGGLVRRLGRDGDGPGEFRAIFHLAIGLDGAALIWDYNGRITRMRPNGEVVRTIPRLGQPAGYAEIDPITALPDGRIIATYWQQRPNREGAAGSPLGGVARDSAPLLVFDSTGRYLSKLGNWTGLERAEVSIGSEPARLPLRFARSVAYAGRGGTTVIGPTDSLDLSVYAGTTLALRLIASAPVSRPSAQDITEWERAILRHDPGVGPTILRALASAPEVPALPAIGGVAIDDRGGLWVGSYPAGHDSSRVWTVFSPTGSPLAQLELPPVTNPLTPGRAEILDVCGDRIAVLRVADSGEEFVDVRGIVRKP